AALENVRPFRAMRPVGADTAKLTVIVRVMAVGAQYPCANRAPSRTAIHVQHADEQAWLRELAGAIVCNWVARRQRIELWNHIQRIRRRHCPQWQVPKRSRVRSLSRAGSVTTEAVFILID